MVTCGGVYFLWSRIDPDEVFQLYSKWSNHGLLESGVNPDADVVSLTLIHP